MAPKKWGEDLNVKFVEAYKEKECLWNQFDPLYKNKLERETALKKLVDEMNLDDFGIVEAKAKIKSLRSTYNLEVEKQRKSEKSGCSVYVPTLKWFNIMEEVMSKGRIQKETHSNMPEVILTENDNDSDFDELTGGGIPATTVSATSPQPSEDIQYDFCQDDDQQLPQPPKRKFRFNKRSHQIASSPRQIHCHSDSLYRNSPEDEWDIFGKFVAAHLKKLSPQRALEAEMRIYVVINECRMQDLTEQTPGSPVP